MSYGADINQFDSEGFASLLERAVLVGDLRTVQFLLEQGAAVDQVDQIGSTPLLAAIKYGNTEIVKVLLAYKANVNYMDPCGNTALHWAVKSGYGEIIRILWTLRAAEDINCVNKDGDTLLTSAAFGKHLDVAKFLLKNGA